MKLLAIRSVPVRWMLLSILAMPGAVYVYPQAPAAAASRPAGTVQSVAANTIVLKLDSGSSLTVTVTPQTKILRAAPGQSLKDAAPIQVSDIQVGDRMLARGTPNADANLLAATTILIMAKGDVAQRQQQELQAWTRNGTGGIVGNIDPASGSITLKTTPGNSVIVHTSPKTNFLRYAASSTKFADATPSSLAQIQPGDQLRARGGKSADGTEFTADAVIAGSFRNMAGTISSVDPAAHSLIIKDLLSKESVSISIAPDSQIKKLPQPMATRIGMMLKRGGRLPRRLLPTRPPPLEPAPAAARPIFSRSSPACPPSLWLICKRVTP